jgi:hypothetical protein
MGSGRRRRHLLHAVPARGRRPTSDETIRHLEHAINVTSEGFIAPELLRFATRKSPVCME